MASLRALTRAMSTPTGPGTVMPKSAARRATWAVRALATRVLVGMQPTLTQVPPNSLRSMMAVFIPASVRRAASGGPAWPVPMMMASNRVVMAWLLPAGVVAVPHDTVGDRVVPGGGGGGRPGACNGGRARAITLPDRRRG